MHVHILILFSVIALGSAQNSIAPIEFEDRTELRGSYFGSLLALGKRNERLESMALERCTRRFTPGVCPGDHKPVWTYVPFRQNCTERLGCREADRENRFRSHVGCMRVCRTLVMMYTNILHQGHNHTSLRSGSEPNRLPLSYFMSKRTRKLDEQGSDEDYDDEDDEDDEDNKDEGQEFEDKVPKVFEQQDKVEEIGAKIDVDEFGQFVVPAEFEDKT